MTKLFLKLVVIFLIVFIASNLLSIVIMQNEKLMGVVYSRMNPFCAYVYDAIKKSKTPSAAKIAIIGDSVAHQIFGGEDEVLDLTTNAYVSMAGQYLLVYNLIKHQPDLRKICLILVPESFTVDLNNNGSYSYFYKPFYTNEYIDLMSPDTLNIIESKPYHLIFRLPLSKVLPSFSVINFSDAKIKNNDNQYLSVTSQYYLEKIVQLCDSSKVIFEVLPAPISAYKYKEYAEMKLSDKISSDCNTWSLKKAIGNYYDKILVFDDKYYNKDKTHSGGVNWSDVTSKTISTYKIMNVPDKRQ